MSERTRLSLDGLWHFQTDPSGQAAADEISEWRQAQVPLPIQAQFDDLRNYSGVSFYRRAFTVDALPVGVALLHFGAVDYRATVWMNGQKVSEHEGGYLPFEFDVSAHLRAGENEILVRVEDADDSDPDIPFREVPHGKQSWYGPIGGIWQSVYLEMRPQIHMRSLRLTPNAATGEIQIHAAVNQPGADRSLVIRITDPNGMQVAQAALNGLDGLLALDNPGDLRLWSPDDPALYTATAELRVDGQTMDELSATFGFRTVEARDGRIYLNGEPVYLRGVLDQAYYPETIYTPPSVEFLEDQVHKAKELGLNCLRIHIKIEDPRYYEVADRLGILVWTEIPNWVHLTPAADRRVKETFRRMVERDWNHPSIIAWSLVNENWGTDLSRDPAHRQWLTDFYFEAKEIDPTRLIVDNSACHGNAHVASDLEDYHHYRAIPDHAQEWDEWVEEFVNRADWCWYEDYQEHRREDLPLLVSEFGNWGLPDPALLDEKGKEPWWFETGLDRGDGIVYPHGMVDRFYFYEMDKLFGSMERFAAQQQRHMSKSLAYEIATMRLYPRIGGYVITEFTDVHWECNGLLDMQRNIKQNLDEFVALNQDQVVVVRPQRWSGRPGDSLPVEMRAFGVDGPAETGKIHWRTGSASGEIPAPGGAVDVPLPTNGTSGLQMIFAQWLGDDGNILGEGMAEVAWTTPTVPANAIFVSDADLAQMLSQLGYTLADTVDGADLIVSRRYTEDLQSAVQQGVRVLLLADPHTGKREGEIRLPTGSVIARAGTSWQGDWATSFSWMKKEGPFAMLPGDPLLEMEYADIMADAVIVGLPAWVMNAHSWANLALGWIHKPVSLLAEIPYGHGKLTVATFNLNDDLLATDAIAQTLFAGLVALAVK
ncbi:MAG: beta galactosidase jelly roll domain-containing protein [Caldilineaceae bacterium]|nr:beta galactosidase jelly roll domain-containing protein [Caldilineaceae bacterium]